MPFIILLAAVAWLPWKWPRLWDWIGFPISIGLALLVVLAYGWRLHTLAPIVDSLKAYLQFMAVIAAFYVVCTNLRITLRCAPTARNNLIVLFTAAVVANIIGTCGATILFIGPYIALNRHHLKASHIFFFIAIAANIGGLLTPLGDPPLMAGYLYGVPFDWMLLHAWPMWCVSLAWLMAIFYLLHRRSYQPAVTGPDIETAHDAIIKIENLLLIAPLAICIAALFLPAAYRVGLLVATTIGVAGIYRRRHNSRQPDSAKRNTDADTATHFGYKPLGEMASLFLGLFITMTPVLAMIGHLPPTARRYISTPSAYFLSVGAASSVLDNTPTYIAGLQAHITTIRQTGKSAEVLAMPSSDVTAMAVDPSSQVYLLAIAMGAVMFGAMTWIGNGPNLLIEMICRQQGIKCPSFGGYIWRYSAPLLLPLLAMMAAWIWLISSH